MEFIEQGATPTIDELQSTSGLKPLVAAAKPLLMLYIGLKNSTACADTKKLRHYIIQEIKNYETKANAFNCLPKHVLAGRYILCTLLDEAVLNNQWGGQSDWSMHTLLALIQKETWGGERFFTLLELMARQPAANLPLLELMYLCLSLGFEGKYYSQQRSVLGRIKAELFELINRQQNSLSLPKHLVRYHKTKQTNRRLLTASNLLTVAVLLAGILIASTFNWVERLSIAQTKSVLAQLHTITKQNKEVFTHEIARSN
ncbi:MAG: type / secretion system protein DotU family [Gammaproteobacteria bacterium]|jgi:type VI secretion system protein ImpK|nr:type / secretion system protein DotU family [Gammaproteobacteria bacterium]